MILQEKGGSEDNWSFYDSMLFGHAFNNDPKNPSKVEIDLSDTPFEIDEKKQKFAAFGNNSKSIIDNETKTNQF